MRILLSISLIIFFAGPAQCKENPLLVFSGPPIAESVPLIAMAQKVRPWNQDFDVRFVPWHSPDMLRAMIVGGQVDAAIITTAASCTLLNKGAKGRIALLYESPVWIVSVRSGPNTLSSLNGTLLFPFGPGEMPELFFKATIGDKPDNIAIRHTSGALEAVNLLLAGKGDHAMLSEPTVSVAISRSIAKHAKGAPLLVRRVNMGKAWSCAFPGHSLAATSMTFFGAKADSRSLIHSFHKAHKQACKWVLKNPSEALALTRQKFPALAAQLNSGKIEHIDIHPLIGEKAVDNALFFLSKIKDISPAAIGGTMPERSLFEVEQ